MKLNSRAAFMCHEYLHKKTAPQFFDLSNTVEPSEAQKLFSELGIQHEARVVTAIKSQSSTWIDLGGAFEAEREAVTIEAMNNTDLTIIFGAVISDSERIGKPDVLIRDGAHSWIPLDIKSHSAFDKHASSVVAQTPLTVLTADGDFNIAGRLDKLDVLQLSHYLRILQSIGFAADHNVAGIIGKDAQSITWMDLSALVFDRGNQSALNLYDSQFNASALVVAAAQSRTATTQQLPAIPRVDATKYGCKTCEFKYICREEMKMFEGSGHITLLAGVTIAVSDVLPSHLQSIQALAEANGLTEKAQLEAQERARVWLKGKPALLTKHKSLDLPEFDIEIDIDLENSMAAVQEIDESADISEDRVFLYGFIRHDRTVSDDWKDFQPDVFEDYSDSDNGEYQLLLNMWNWMQEQVAIAEAESKSIGFFHYSTPEITWWKRFVNRHGNKPGVPSLDEVTDFISKYFVDLLKYTKRCAFPAMGYSIKDLAPLAGFEGYLEGAGGDNAMAIHKTAIDSSNPEAMAAQKWLSDYNKNDVRATMSVRNWMRTLNL
jgi:predicted RecB family nuclease